MSVDEKIRVVLCWHMHQPQYCDLVTGEYQLPWTYLHAIKDYTDMAAHLEDNPDARAVVNFAPILLEQIDDYAGQVQGFLKDSKPVRDPLLAALSSPTFPAVREQRLALVKSCKRANEKRLIERFPAYQKLVEMAGWFEEHPHGMSYVDDQFLADILVWYHLAWIGETVRRSSTVVRGLQEKAHGFTLQDRRDLLGLIGELLSGIIRRYRNLAESGRVELSVTPYAHPIVPLLLDFESARDAMPNVDLPHAPEYPGGAERARWHIEEGIATFEQYFGFRPGGCWPSEGSVSGATLNLLDEYGFRWAASGETVLHNSLAQSGDGDYRREDALYKPHCFGESGTHCFFRDDGLSDLLGFTYSDWHADDAVANLVHHLENIAGDVSDPGNTVVSIVLDGENAWEYYPENGYHFLNALYRDLGSHPNIELTTFSRCIEERVEAPRLSRMVAGSWVYGTFSTWMGDADKNRGWDMLVEAKRVYDEVMATNGLEGDRALGATHQLSICEGSDWFWWFGDYNPSDTVSDFDRLYRIHLANLYQLLGKSPPESLAHAFSHGTGAPARGGVMRQGQQQGR